MLVFVQVFICFWQLVLFSYSMLKKGGGLLSLTAIPNPHLIPVLYGWALDSTTPSTDHLCKCDVTIAICQGLHQDFFASSVVHWDDVETHHPIVYLCGRLPQINVSMGCSAFSYRWDTAKCFQINWFINQFTCTRPCWGIRTASCKLHYNCLFYVENRKEVGVNTASVQTVTWRTSIDTCVSKVYRILIHSDC